MNIRNLAGFTLESCRLSKSSYTFEFCGQLKTEYKTLLVSTSYYFSLLEKGNADAGKRFSLEIWPFLEKKLISVSVDENENLSRVTFDFGKEDRFFIWADAPLADNLLFITDQETGDWFPVC